MSMVWKGSQVKRGKRDFNSFRIIAYFNEYFLKKNGPNQLPPPVKIYVDPFKTEHINYPVKQWHNFTVLFDSIIVWRLYS
jgi:hypothetical protein